MTEYFKNALHESGLSKVNTSKINAKQNAA